MEVAVVGLAAVVVVLIIMEVEVLGFGSSGGDSARKSSQRQP